ncbi:hypothetical protein [Haloterrigena alkaliphila]|nr:hypothetical protein [Haloterrigena alkaliphila]QSX00469.2 hypothetical protein J0X25_05745 [Haloterrigena alkaliphila]
MARQDKMPWAPWNNSRKWSNAENWANKATVDEWVETDPRVDGHIAILEREDDPYTDDPDPFAFIDGDDVRCPKSGEVHPQFVAVLKRLGITYADVSTSGSGVHALYVGKLPTGYKQAKFAIDDEPWGTNEDVPEIEIYDGKRVCVVTGEHVPGTPLEVNPWDEEELKALLEERVPEADKHDIEGYDTDRERPELDDYEPSATGDETTDDVRDVFYAIEQLRPSDLPLCTRQVGTDATGWEKWDPSSYRPSSGGDSLHRPPGEPVFHDHKTGHAFSLLSLFAAEQGIISKPWHPLEGAEFRETVTKAREAGAPIPKYVEEKDDPRDLLDQAVIVDPDDAVRAARAVQPSDLEKPVETLEDAGDVALAVATTEEMVTSPEEGATYQEYTRGYELAREKYGAPLPKYLDETALTDNTSYVFGAVSQLDPELVLERAKSTVTVENPIGTATAKINPVWEESDSGERVLAGYGRGFWCVEHEVSFSPLEFIALENDLLDDEGERLRGEAFKRAYTLAREDYGAPLPKWCATLLEHVAVLPPAARVLDDASAEIGIETLEEARDRVEELLLDAGTVRDRAQLVTTLPALGKTYSAIKAAEENPTTYLAGRNELKEQAVEYARETGVSFAHLPVLAKNRVDDAALVEAVCAVREQDKTLLKDRDALLSVVEAPLDPKSDEEAADDGAELERGSCPTANGEYGDAWRLVIQTARALGHTPAEIHIHATALFGEELPCQESGDCEYSRAWERLTDPDAPIDLLIGGHGHAHVESARTWYGRNENGDQITRPRAVVIDEFPGLEYANGYGEAWRDHATWLASCLTDDVGDVESLLDANLADDSWVSAWLDGEASDLPQIHATVARLRAATGAIDAIDAAEDVLEDMRGLCGGVKVLQDLETALLDLTDLPTELPVDTLGNARDAVETAKDRAEEATNAVYGERQAAERLGADPIEVYGVLNDVEDCITDRLTSALESATEASFTEGQAGNDLSGYEAIDIDLAPDELDAELPIAGDLEKLVQAATEAVRECRDASDLVKAAATALEGGSEGCRELAVFSEDGYAHPRAWLLLAGAIGDGSDITTMEYSLDREAGTNLKRVTHAGATVIVDRNHHGAIVHNPPEFVARGGEKCPLIGLDATARPKLWRLAIGRDAERRDVHDTAGDRRRFLEQTMNTRVVQTSRNINTYGGDLDGNNFGGPLAVLDAACEKYDEEPAVITTKKAREYLGDDLENRANVVDHYLNVTGSDALGERNVGAILGVQHFGDQVVEKWAALAGEEVERTGHGNSLDYGGEIANDYRDHMLKDQTMQAALRFGRSDEPTVVFTHTSALRDDLPVVAEASVVSAHSKATLAVAKTARKLGHGQFSSGEVYERMEDDYTRRTIRNVLANLTNLGYLKRDEANPGTAHAYTLTEDPGTGEADWSEVDLEIDEEAENPRMCVNYTWNFLVTREGGVSAGAIAPPTPVICSSAILGKPPNIASSG